MIISELYGGSEYLAWTLTRQRLRQDQPPLSAAAPEVGFWGKNDVAVLITRGLLSLNLGIQQTREDRVSDSAATNNSPGELGS